MAPASVVDRLGAAADAVRRVRPAVRVIAVAGAVALVAAIVVVAAPGVDAVPGAAASGSASATRPPSAGRATTPTSTPSASRSDAPEQASSAASDPLVALDALLDARQSCWRSLSADCLGGVDQQGSGAAADDAATLDAVRDGAPAPDRPSTRGARIAQHLGDGVLVRLGAESDAGSLLLIRTDDGWRIRDWIDDDAATRVRPSDP